MSLGSTLDHVIPSEARDLLLAMTGYDAKSRFLASLGMTRTVKVVS